MFCRYAAQVAIHANCSPELPHPHLMRCLRERPLEALMSTPVRDPEFAFAFGPSVDGVVIDTDEPSGRNLTYLSHNIRQDFSLFLFRRSTTLFRLWWFNTPTRSATKRCKYSK